MTPADGNLKDATKVLTSLGSVSANTMALQPILYLSHKCLLALLSISGKLMVFCNRNEPPISTKIQSLLMLHWF